MNDDESTRSAPERADADLVLRARDGDTGAFAELWRRHYRSGIVVARSVTSSIDPDDLVQEAYARILRAIRNGGGPTGAFRAYLFTSIRNTAAGWGRARRDVAIDDVEAWEDPVAHDHATDEALDRSLAHRAFRSLPTRWQEVLWYTEVEQLKPAQVAPLLGLRPSAVAQLAFRAREGLREAWVQAHLRSVAPGSDCAWTIDRLGAYARGTLGRRDLTRLEGHLAGCPRCTIVASEAETVSQRLPMVLLPLAIGSLAATSYLATLQGGGTPVVALAAGTGPAGAVDASSAGSIGTGAGSTGAGAGAGGGSIGGGAALGTAAHVSGAITTLSGVASVLAVAVAGSVLSLSALAAPTWTGAPTVAARPASPTAEAAPPSPPPPASTAAPTPSAPSAEAQEPRPAPPAVAPRPAPTPARPAPSPAPTGAPGPAPTPTPSPTPTPAPTPAPSPAPTPTPTVSPTPPVTFPSGTPSLLSYDVQPVDAGTLVTLLLAGEPGASARVSFDADERVFDADFDREGRAEVAFLAGPSLSLLGVTLSVAYRLGDQVSEERLTAFLIWVAT